jgi:hypothetical protein
VEAQTKLAAAPITRNTLINSNSQNDENLVSINHHTEEPIFQFVNERDVRKLKRRTT